VWAQTDLTDTAAAVATNRTTDLLAGFVTAGGSTQGVTVMRIHADFSFRSDQTTINGSRLVQGFAVGTSGVDPTTTPYEDWMLNRSWFVGAAGQLLTANSPNVGEVDIRSKRKCDEVGQSLYHSMRFVVGAAGTETTFSYRGQFRVLLALP